MASIFANVEVGPKIEVFALNKLYVEDTSLVKVNLGVGGKLFTSIYVVIFLFFTLIRSTLCTEFEWQNSTECEIFSDFFFSW